MADNQIDTLDLKQSDQILELFGNVQEYGSNPVIEKIAPIEFSFGTSLNTDRMCFYRIDKLSYDEDYPRREAFENVLYSLDNDAFNFVYMLTGTKQGVELCVGVVENHKENQTILGQHLSAVNYGQTVVSALEGNFSGSVLTRLGEEELQKKVLLSGTKYGNAGIIMGIPSINESGNGKEYDFQGIDRLINSMLGLEWRIVVVCEPVSKKEILEMKEDIYELYNRLAIYSKMTVQRSVNAGDSISFGRSVSDSHGKNRSYNESDTKTKGEGNSSGTKNSSDSKQKGWGVGDSKDHSEGSNSSYTRNKGSSESVTLEIANKHAQDIMQYIDEELLPRIKLGYSKGLFKTSVYYMSDKPAHVNRLKVAIMSLFQGNKSTFSPLVARKLNLRDSRNQKCLSLYQNSYERADSCSLDAMLLLGRPVDENGVGLSSYLTTNEVSILAGLPQKEVPGISLKEGVDFGLNEKKIADEDAIKLGFMVQKGRELEGVPFYLSKSAMAKHTFIAGVTGSGKTTTCHKLLAESNTPFLVIEPAKTEYRTLVKQNRKFGKVYVFTLGNENVAPFRINPFELIPGEVISAHVDMLKATFTSAFPMEASMPQILEEAIYKCYEKKGWNIDTNENDYYEKPFEHKDCCFPILSELLDVMREIVKSKGFSPQMQADYEGSLVSRLSNLTVGSKGRMLNCRYSLDFRFVAYHNVILEMEELKSPEDKALIMGFVLSRLSAVIRNEHKRDSSYRHLTLVEEAHRLLSKVEYGDSGSKKTAVETFTDMLAEVRKYGEGLVIVDQIPNKLASEVLKNTNTKIIHKILARDDKDAVGDTMLMDDNQKNFLSALDIGHAIVFTESLEKPIHIHIQAETDTNKNQIEDEIIKEEFQKNREAFGSVYEDLEILPFYGEFKTVTDEIARFIINREKCRKLKRIVQNIHEKSGMSQKRIWMEFIFHKERIAGNILENEKTEELIEPLSEYLERLFSRDMITEDDLDHRMCRKLL